MILQIMLNSKSYDARSTGCTVRYFVTRLFDSHKKKTLIKFTCNNLTCCRGSTFVIIHHSLLTNPYLSFLINRNCNLRSFHCGRRETGCSLKMLFFCSPILCRWLKDHARKGNFDVTIENVTDDISVLGIAGPYSRSVLSKLTPTDMSNSQFKFLTFKDIELAGLPVRAMRISYSGE